MTTTDSTSRHGGDLDDFDPDLWPAAQNSAADPSDFDLPAWGDDSGLTAARPRRALGSGPAYVDPDPLDEHPHGRPKTVFGTVVTSRTWEARPVVPAWLRNRDERRSTAVWAARYVKHATAYHGARTPLYSARAVARAPRGVGRAVAATARWVTDAESRPLRSEAVARNDAKGYMTLSRERAARVNQRSWLLGGLVVVALVLLVLAALLLPGTWQAAAAVVALLLLARLGSSPDAPLLDRAVVAPEVARLSSDTIVRALLSLGVAGITQGQAKGGSPIGFPAPITRDGPGWRSDVDLPHGVTWTDVAERRDRLASGLRRPLGCVWPEGDPTAHAGRLVLWVGDQPMSEAKAPAWPLAKAGQADLFRPIPFGHDARMRPVYVRLVESNVLIGSMPGAGKTFALRALLLGAALDPTAQLWLYELKGSGDLSALEPVAHRYGSGVDDATAEACLLALREVHKDLERRAGVIAALPRHDAPENKVTPDLARRRDLGLFPLVFAIDECQELFSHPTFGAESGDLATAIIKRGRALGVVLLLATQRPDRDSLPTGVSANVGTRFCLRVMGQVENDMVLGTSAYKNGFRSTTFTARDKGIGYLGGVFDEPTVVRSAYLDGPAAERVIVRARALRTAAGTITGHAAGEAAPVAEDPVRLLSDVLTVWSAGDIGRGAAWTGPLAEALADHDPDGYTGWDARRLGDELRTRGVPVVDMHRKRDGEGVTRPGCKQDDVAAAVTAGGAPGASPGRRSRTTRR
ncbi:FtsK/SpoIIIE domain-containing protein [Kineosporia sp. A_224]|uniref:FtsK/SpoIIIE domain-containing protein n=1 Tax=Kineosporia sp. A_224 TaxID=1962180 RepID=UPI000B4BE548|nr:FtsK/SpoIIIE domain-containing protein [Kineosporia sp. A_224]